jgi:hypothetical protein
MKDITKWMLAAALAVGGLGLTAAPAKAAQIGVYIGAGPAYAPPCPGPGYAWIAGYYSNGYWVPGRWAFTGVYINRDGHSRNSFDRDHRDNGRTVDRRDNRGNNDQHDSHAHGR